jgi:hypothetical protein
MTYIVKTLSLILLMISPITAAFPKKNIYLTFTRIDVFKHDIPGTISNAQLELHQSELVYNYIFDFNKIYKLEVEDNVPFEMFLFNKGFKIYLFHYMPNDKNDSTINFTLPSIYNVDSRGGVCPKCNNSDMTIVQKQQYYSYEIESENETSVIVTTDSTKGEKVFSGTYYCERDSVFF